MLFNTIEFVIFFVFVLGVLVTIKNKKFHHLFLFLLHKQLSDNITNLFHSFRLLYWKPNLESKNFIP